MILPASSISTPGISISLPFLGPTPDKKRRFPTFFECGYEPTGFGAFVDSYENSLFTPTNIFCLCKEV